MLVAAIAQAPPSREREVRATQFSLVEFHGLLPRQAAAFLGSLSQWDLAAVFPVPGRFEEVRALLEGARILHLCLKEGPQSAARGRITFTEFMKEKRSLFPEIMAFRRRLNAMADRLHLRAPRLKRTTEVSHAA